MKSEFGLRKQDSKHHWQKCDLEKFEVRKPLVICLSGDATDTAADANGLCKLAESLLGDKAQNVDLMGAVYGDKSSCHRKFFDEDIEGIVDNILMPLCRDKKTNDVLSAHDCCKNLSLVTFFTYCHGSTEVEKIMQNFSERLAEIGFSEEKIMSLLQSTIEISYASEINSMMCPRVLVGSKKDTMGSLFDYWYFDDFEGDYAEEKMKNSYAMICDKPGEYCGKTWPRPDRNFGSITIIADTILKDNNDINLDTNNSEDHSIGFFSETMGGLNPRLNEQGKVLRQAMAKSLGYRVENSLENLKSDFYSKFYLEELYTNLENELPQERRIDNSREHTFENEN